MPLNAMSSAAPRVSGLHSTVFVYARIYLVLEVTLLVCFIFLLFHFYFVFSLYGEQTLLLSVTVWVFLSFKVSRDTE